MRKFQVKCKQEDSINRIVKRHLNFLGRVLRKWGMEKLIRTGHNECKMGRVKQIVTYLTSLMQTKDRKI